MVTTFFSGELLKITPQGTVSIIATGLGTAYGLAIDSSGNYIIAGDFPERLLKITPEGSVSIIANGFGVPIDVAIDSSGNYVVAVVDRSTDSSKVIKITPSGNITTIFDSFPSNGLTSGIAIDSNGNYIVTTLDTEGVYKLTPNGILTTVRTGIAPNDVAIDTDGNYIVPEGVLEGNHIIKLTPSGVVSIIASGIGNINGIAIVTKSQQQALSDLIKLGKSLGASTNVLGEAVKLLNDSNPYNDKGACGKISAFINQVNSNHGLTVSQKSPLISAANAIKTSIHC